jgi:hypothetical protein
MKASWISWRIAGCGTGRTAPVVVLRDRPVAGGTSALDVHPQLGPGPESVFLGEDELGVSEQEPPGGPGAQHLRRPVPGGIPRLDGRSRCLACLR